MASVDQANLAGALNLARKGPREPGEDAHQAGLAHAIGSAHVQHVAGAEIERQLAEKQALAATAGEIASGEAGLHGCAG